LRSGSAQIERPCVTLAFVDASRIESYAQALSGSQIAISCMASRNVDVDSTDDFWAIDRDANIRFGIEAVRAGAKQIILVATFEGRDSRGLTEFSNAKESAVDAIGAACRQQESCLRSSGLPPISAI